MYELLGRSKENRRNIMYVIDTADLEVDAITERELISFMRSDPSVLVSGFTRQPSGKYKIDSSVEDATIRVLYKDAKLRFSVIESVFKGTIVGSSVRKLEVLVKSRDNILHLPLFTCEEFIDRRYLTDIDLSVTEMNRSDFGLVFKMRTVDMPELCQTTVYHINIDQIQANVLYQGEEYSSISESEAALTEER